MIFIKRLCHAELHNMKTLLGWTKWYMVKYKTHTTFSHFLLTQGIHLHCPKSMSDCSFEFVGSLFHDKHIEYITLNLYKHPAYKSPKDWIKRKSLHFEEKIALTQCFEINDKACRAWVEFTLATFKQDTKKLPWWLGG